MTDSMVLDALADHLWQSTLFIAAAALLAAAFRRNRAHVRYWIWFAASVKFLVPFALLMALGQRIEWRPAVAPTPSVNAAIEILAEPFSDEPLLVARGDP